MFLNYLLFILGKSTKVIENVNQNYSEEWSSHIQGFLSAATECSSCSGRAEGTPMEH